MRLPTITSISWGTAIPLPRVVRVSAFKPPEPRTIGAEAFGSNPSRIPLHVCVLSKCFGYGDPLRGRAVVNRNHGCGHSASIPLAPFLAPSPGAVGPASSLWRRYSDAPAAALLTGLTTGEWSPLRFRPYGRS